MYPDLFDDEQLSRNLARARDLVANRTVSLVGNAESLLRASSGPQIDSADVVVRLNRGFVHNRDAQGARTDILFLSMRIGAAEILAHFGHVEIIYGNRDRWVMSEDMWSRRLSLAYYPLSSFRALSARLSGSRPSTGLIAVDLLMNGFQAGRLRLFGFDWKATKTFYEPELRYNVHDWTAERDLVLRWANEGALEIIETPLQVTGSLPASDPGRTFSTVR